MKVYTWGSDWSEKEKKGNLRFRGEGERIMLLVLARKKNLMNNFSAGKGEAGKKGKCGGKRIGREKKAGRRPASGGGLDATSVKGLQKEKSTTSGIRRRVVLLATKKEKKAHVQSSGGKEGKKGQRLRENRSSRRGR